MSVVRKLRQRIHQTAAKPHIGFFFKSEFPGNLVGGLKSDSPDFICKLIRIFLHHGYTAIAILLIYFCGKGRADLMLLEKKHNVLDFFLPLP